MKRALLLVITSLSLAACGNYPSGPEEGAVWVGKGDGTSFDGVLSITQSGTTLYANCPLGQLCGMNINNWWIEGIEMPATAPPSDAERYGLQSAEERYGLTATTRTETGTVTETLELPSQFDGLSDPRTFSVFQGAAELTIKPKFKFPLKDIDTVHVNLEFPTCGHPAWCPSFKKAFRWAR